MNSSNLGNLTDEQKQKLDELSDEVMKKVFTRIVSVLTDEDIKKIQELDKDDQNGQAVRYFIYSKIPNFEAIVEEEAAKLKVNF